MRLLAHIQHFVYTRLRIIQFFYNQFEIRITKIYRTYDCTRQTLLRIHSHYSRRVNHKNGKSARYCVAKIFFQFLFTISQSKRGKKDGKKCGNSVGGEVACKLIDASSDAACKITQIVVDGVIYACVSK